MLDIGRREGHVENGGILVVPIFLVGRANDKKEVCAKN